MDEIPGQILRIVGAAILCTVIVDLMPKGKQSIIKIICSVFMGITILLPITGFKISDFSKYEALIDQSAASITEEGAKQANKAQSDIIKDNLEAYILKKATDMGADITASITLSNSLEPESISIEGDTAPYTRQQIEKMITTDIGIPKERQNWN